MADKQTNELYADLRGQWGEAARGNGYQLDSFFRAEQAVVLSALREQQPILDIACGSGLMTLPLSDKNLHTFGVDYNADACAEARRNGVAVCRGDAFSLPLPDNCVGEIVNCQFLNQQTDADTSRFLSECARVLQPAGRLVITWRHAQSWLHRSATAWLRLRRDPAAAFPQYVHPLSQVIELAGQSGLGVERTHVTLPLKTERRLHPDSFLANVLGASLFAVFVK